MTEPTPTHDDRPSLRSVPRARLLRGLLAFAAVLGLLVALHGYLGARLASPLGGLPAAAGWALLGAGVLSLPLGAFSLRAQGPAARVLYWAGMLWLGAFGVLLGLTALGDVGAVAWRLATGVWPEPHARALTVLAVAAVALPWAVWTARGRARVTRRTVRIPGLPPALAGVRIAQVSDLHVGPTLDAVWLTRVVDDVLAQRPDLVAVTGDLVDGGVAQLRDHVAPLARLTQAPLGAFYVTGNHEYYHGGPAWAAEVARLGLHVLLNRHVVVERDGARLTVAGVTDHDAGHLVPGHACRPDLALAGAPADAPRLLLAHQPRTAALARGLGVALQLSGHTHGGQVFPFNLFVRLQQPAVRGLATLWGTPVYTHRGTGYWGPPMRLGSPPELAVLELQPA